MSTTSLQPTLIMLANRFQKVHISEPLTLSFSEAIHYCDNMGLQLPVPDSLVDNKKLLDLGLFSFVRQSERTFICTNFWKLFKATEKNNYWPLNVPLGILKVGNNWINIYTQDELNFEPSIWENKTESVSGSTVVLNTRAQVGFLIDASNYWYYCSHIMLVTKLLSW